LILTKNLQINTIFSNFYFKNFKILNSINRFSMNQQDWTNQFYLFSPSPRSGECGPFRWDGPTGAKRASDALGGENLERVGKVAFERIPTPIACEAKQNNLI
jgi:hypothetical protein